MSLLQISEPGFESPVSTHRLAVGIDLGTTNSLVATGCGGRVEILPDLDGEYLLPSVVQYRKGSPPVVGEKAKATAVADPENTVISVKRLLGKSATEIKNSDTVGRYRLDSSRDEKAPALLTANGSRDPVQVSADILKALIARAEDFLKGKLEGAVITVPAYFNDAQRQQTRDAARLAGLKVLRLLNEPTAAAVAYGLDSKDQGNVVVFDLGGGTFDVSLLSLKKGIFQVLATGGDTALGGDDFDNVLAEWLSLQVFGGKKLDLGEQSKLLHYANQIKHQLSDLESVELSYADWSGRLSHVQFSTLCEDLINRTIKTCRRVLRDASKSVGDIDNIVMVGGATRMPAIRAAVTQYFGKPPLTHIDPDRAVAIGAGVQAEILIGNKAANNFLLLDVNPLSLGIETMGELVEKIIPRNTTIPVARAQEFTTFKDGQTAMKLHVVQGERELVSDCRSLAHFELRGIPPMVAGAAKVRVTFQVDADGLLSVIAEECSTGQTAEIQVKPSYGLDADSIEQMLKLSHEHAHEDMELRALKEAQLEASQLIEAIDSAIEVDGGLLTKEEARVISSAITELKQALDKESSGRIHEQTEKLNKVSSEFAARRMDLHIGKGLRGESIDAVDQSNK